LSGKDSTFMDLSLHVDYKVGRLYPLVESNWIDTVDGGRRLDAGAGWRIARRD
jgi:hypothetical protein